MDREFWLERWDSNQIGFHQPAANPLLARHWPLLGVPEAKSVFVPLCGKSLDMRWLASCGHHVFGVEWSASAIESYYEEGNEVPDREGDFYLDRYHSESTTIYCGDFINLATLDIWGTGAVYDRGALVALPPALRARYADHLQRIVPEHAKMLLITLEYDQSKVAGPPFSVTAQEVEQLYAERCTITLLEETTTSLLPPKFSAAGIDAAKECVYKIVKEH